MNILYHQRTRGRGAEGVHIMGIVRALRKLQHTVNILSFPGSDPEHESVPDRATEKKPNPVASIAKLTKYFPEFLFELFELAYNLLIFFRLPKAIKCHQVELIYERYSLFMFAGIYCARKRNIPIVIEINDSALVERVRPLFFNKLARKIEKWCFQNATGLVFISTYFQQLSIKEYGKIAPSSVCPNAADPEYFNPSKYQSDDLKESLKLTGKTVCGYVGAFVKWHGIVWFIEEISPILKQHPNLAFLLVGDGVCYPEIAALIDKYQLNEQIILTGNVAHKDVPKYLAIMDYGILPDSNLYGSSMKHFEFMSMACGMLVPAFSPMQEVVTDGENSWLFTPGDKKECIEKVLSLAKSPENLEKVGQQARKYIVEQRQWLHNAEEILRLAS